MSVHDPYRTLPMTIWCWIALLTLAANGAVAADTDVVLNEIMFDCELPENYGEFVEIVNTGPDSVALDDWTIGDQDDVDGIIPREGGLSLAPGQYGIILDPDYPADDTTYAIPAEALILQLDGSTFGSAGLSNSTAETIFLRNASGDTIASYTYSLGNLPGHSDEKMNATGGDDPANWADSQVLHGTPGFENSVMQVGFDLAVGSIQFVPDPGQPGQPVLVRVLVRNVGTQPGQPFAVEIGADFNFDGVLQTEEWLDNPISQTASIAPGDSLAVDWTFAEPQRGVYPILVSISYDPDMNLINNDASARLVVGERPVVCNEIYYLPLTGDGEVEWVELTSRSEVILNLAGWTFEDATGNPVVLTDELLPFAPDEFLILTADSVAFQNRYPDQTAPVLELDSWPTLNNSGDTITLRFADGVMVDQVPYEDSWGGQSGVSLERRLVDVDSDDPANWGTCLAADGATPGARNTIAPQDYDLGLRDNSLTFTPTHPQPGQEVTLHATVYNEGLLPVTNFQVTIFVDADFDSLADPGELNWQETVDVTLAPGDSVVANLQWESAPLGIFSLHAIVATDTDENPANNQTGALLRVGAAQLAINELMYQPDTGDNQPEWIELFNRTDFDLNLQQWTLEDGTAQPTIIIDEPFIVPPQSYLIMSADATEFAAYYPAVEAAVLEPAAWPSLNNTGDVIVLRLSDQTPVDSLAYSDNWGGDTGQTLERILPEDATNDSTNWATCLDPSGGTPGVRNSVSPQQNDAAMLDPLQFDPPHPQENEPVTITFTVENVGLETLLDLPVFIFADTDFDSLPDPGEILETVTIPSLAAGENFTDTATLSFPTSVVAIGGYIDSGVDQNSANNLVITPLLIGEQPLAINEIYYAPVSGEGEVEWIECYNRSDQPLNLQNWTVEDENANPRLLTTRQTVLAPDAFVILTADSIDFVDRYPDQPALVVEPETWPSLNNSGDTVVLRLANSTAVDSVPYRSSWGGATGVSLERILPEASSVDSLNWGSSIAPNGVTPGQRNSLSPQDYDLAFAEIPLQFDPPHPQAGENFTISGEVLNVGLHTTSSFTLTLFADTDYDSLLDPSEVIYEVTGPALAAGDSWSFETPFVSYPTAVLSIYGQISDTNDDNLLNNQITASLVVGAHPLTINEIYYQPASGAGEVEWIEVVNRSPLAVNLQNWQFADENDTPHLITTTPALLETEAFAILTADSVALSARYPDLAVPIFKVVGWPSLNNSGDAPTIRTNDGTLVDRVPYRSTWGGATGVSLERLLIGGSSVDSTNWASSEALDGATPGGRNSIVTQDYDLGVVPGSLQLLPPSPEPNQPFTVQMTIRNVGLLTASDFMLTVYADANLDSLTTPNEVIDEIDLSSVEIPSGETLTLETGELTFPLAVVPIVCQLTYSADQNPRNNALRTDFIIGQQVVVLNEIYYLPNTEAGEPEWLEGYNRSTWPLNLQSWTIEDATATARPVTDTRFIIEPESYFIVTADTTAFADRYPDVSAHILQPAGWPSLNNTADILALRLPNRQLADSLEYSQNWGGGPSISLERIAFPVASTDPDNWGSSQALSGATPGAKNSIAAPDFDVSMVDSATVSPPDPSSGTLIELTGMVKNVGLNSISDVAVIIFDDADLDSTASPTEHLTTVDLDGPLAPGDVASFAATITLEQIGTHRIGYQIDSSSDQKSTNNLHLFPINVGQGYVRLNEIMYSPDTDGAEWVEIVAPVTEEAPEGTHVADLQGWFIADDNRQEWHLISENPIPLAAGEHLILTSDAALFQAQFPNVTCTVLEPVDGLPSLGNSEDQVVLYDFNGTMMDSVAYTADWGGARGRSLERITTTVPSTDSQNWDTCVAAAGGTPCQPNSIAADYPLPDDVQLSIEPNPFSPDNDGFQDHALISVQLPLALAVSNLQIYDIQGRLVKRLLHQQNVGNRITVIWDGTDDDGDVVRIGQYIVYLEALNGESGQVVTEKKRIVVAGRM